MEYRVTLLFEYSFLLKKQKQKKHKDKSVTPLRLWFFQTNLPILFTVFLYPITRRSHFYRIDLPTSKAVVLLSFMYDLFAIIELFSYILRYLPLRFTSNSIICNCISCCRLLKEYFVVILKMHSAVHPIVYVCVYKE